MLKYEDLHDGPTYEQMEKLIRLVRVLVFASGILTAVALMR